MSNKPESKKNYKGISVTNWGGGRYSIQKRFKKKDSDEWENTNTYFKNELVELVKLLEEYINEHVPDASTKSRSLMDSLPVQQPVPFGDEDVPF